MESVPACIWPAPRSVSPGQSRPALLTHSLTPRTARPGRTRLSLTHSLTQTDPHGRTRNGDGREPEQPVQHRLPSRPLVMKKENFFKYSFPTSARSPHSQTCQSARSPQRTPPHTPLSWKPEMLLCKLITLFKPLQQLCPNLAHIQLTDSSFHQCVNTNVFSLSLAPPQQNVHRWTELANNTR